MPDSQVSSDFLVGVLAVLAFLAGAVAFVAPKFRRWGRFLDAWEGYVDPATGDKVPGVPARLTAVELAQRLAAQQAEQLAGAVARVEDQAGAAASAAAAVTQDVHHLSGQVAEVDRKVDEVVTRQDVNAAEQTQLREAVQDLTRTVGKDASNPPSRSTS